METTRRPTLSAIGDRSATLAGGVLSVATRAMSRVRDSTKPLHPIGEVMIGRLHHEGGADPTGVEWLDSTGEEEVVVRSSRAIGLPSPLPDIHGLALRVPVDDGHADLLFASTGLGRMTRFVLLPGRRIASRPLSTLLPYRGPEGALNLAAKVVSETEFTLWWSRGLGPWQRFARLELMPAGDQKPTVSFDPIAHHLPDLPPYGWVRRLRAPAYRAARDESHRSASPWAG